MHHGGAATLGQEAAMTKTTLVVLAVVRHEGRYLLVQECDGTFYLPAGRVEPGENLMAAAVRETAEEGGIAIGLSGILGFDHTWIDGPPARARLRFVFVGYPAFMTPPKSRADEHSLGAGWFARPEIERLSLRDPEVTAWIDRFERGPALLPCNAYSWDGPDRSAAWSTRLG
jgi:8-oxo-dGTP pyrophosphatase MutT (NUDIX family)